MWKFANSWYTTPQRAAIACRTAWAGRSRGNLFEGGELMLACHAEFNEARYTIENSTGERLLVTATGLESEEFGA